MDVLFSSLAWGTPLGIALFFFFSCSGAGILFWGLSHFIKSTKESEQVAFDVDGPVEMRA